MRILVMSIAEGWDLPDRLLAQGHEVVGWVRPSWHGDESRPVPRHRSRLLALARRLNVRRAAPPAIATEGRPLASRLDALGIRRVECPDCNADTFVREVRDQGVDLIIVAGYPTILRGPLLAAPRWGVINCHHSLLPAYRGPQPVFWAIRNGEARTGVSVHVMTEAIDKGTLLAQVAVPIGPDDTAGSLIAKLGAAAAPLVAGVVTQIGRGEATGVPSIVDEPSYFGGRKFDDVQIDWRRGSREILNQLHAVMPWDGLEGSITGLPVMIRDAQAVPCSRGRPGHIVSINRGQVTVRTGDGALVLTDFQIRPLHGWIGQCAAVLFLQLGQIFSVLE